MSDISLYEALKQYAAGETYPFHMPGHKRRLGPMEGSGIYDIDITEIDGFDNLHHSISILKEAQERAAALYGAEETHFLVNGSTAGLLSAVSGCTGRGGHILIARNCHKAVYHGAELRGLRVSYLYPEWDAEYGINGSIRPEAVREALKRCGTDEQGGIQAVLITSPTYDGVVSDIRGIASVVHEYGLPLIVDEAHGAHLGFHKYFPESAVRLGADVVIQSLHKTMPSLTQTALIHINGQLADRDRIRKYLAVYQTSSPSYVLMASMDSCIRLIEEQGGRLFEEYADRLMEVRRRIKGISGIRLIGQEDLSEGVAYGMDHSKLILSVPPRDGVLRGRWLSDILRSRYGLELEMAAGGYALAMTGPGDDEEGFERLCRALAEISRQEGDSLKCGNEIKYPCIPRGQTVREIGDMEEARLVPVKLSKCAGRVSGEYIYLYPPGIPLIVPGERIAAGLPEILEGYLRAGFDLSGLADTRGGTILTLVE